MTSNFVELNADQIQADLRQPSYPVDEAIGRGIGRTLAMSTFRRQQQAEAGSVTTKVPVLSRQQLRALQRASRGRFAEIRQVGQRLAIAPKGVPLYLRWQDTGELLRPGELQAGTKVTICRDTGRVARPEAGAKHGAV